MSLRVDHGEDALNEVHEINVTPFIDVMLCCSLSSWWRRRSLL
jgi:biopolymer transport protein ExbD